MTRHVLPLNQDCVYVSDIGHVSTLLQVCACTFVPCNSPGQTWLYIPNPITEHSCVVKRLAWVLLRSPEGLCSMLEQCLADGWVAHLECKARKWSYKALERQGDGQVRELSAICCFPLLFVSDVSSDELRLLKSPKRGQFGNYSHSLGWSQFSGPIFPF